MRDCLTSIFEIGVAVMWKCLGRERRHCRSLGRVAPHQEQVSLDNIAGIIAAESRPVVRGNAIIYHIILRFGFAVI